MNSLNSIGTFFFFFLKKTLTLSKYIIFLKNLQISSTGPADIETQKYLKKRKNMLFY